MARRRASSGFSSACRKVSSGAPSACASATSVSKRGALCPASISERVETPIPARRASSDRLQPLRSRSERTRLLTTSASDGVLTVSLIVAYLCGDYTLFRRNSCAQPVNHSDFRKPLSRGMLQGCILADGLRALSIAPPASTTAVVGVIGGEGISSGCR
jgi:hypothetical protein